MFDDVQGCQIGQICRMIWPILKCAGHEKTHLAILRVGSQDFCTQCVNDNVISILYCLLAQMLGLLISFSSLFMLVLQQHHNQGLFKVFEEPD